MLAQLCSEGDRWAVEELYRRYAAKVYVLCLRYAADDDAAKDLTQESFVKTIEKIAIFKYRGKGSLYAWISRIALNLALDYIKRRRWKTVSLVSIPGNDLPEPLVEEIDAVPQDKLLEWISKLPDLRRAVFNLYCIDGFTHKDIAKKLGISEKGSASVLAKARKQLKSEIRQYLNERDK